MQKTVLVILASLLLVLAGCSSTPEKDEFEETKLEVLTAQELFDRAKASLRDGNYTRAIESLEEIDTRYPFGSISEQAKMDLIYAYFKKSDYDAGQALADRFLRQYPQHENADYVYYMKGVMHYEQEVGFFKDTFQADIETRDTANLEASFDNFKALVEVYPNSKYAPDARQRMIQLRNLLAENQLHIAQYYMERDIFIAAANRAKYIVENYPKTPVIPNALDMLVKTYNLLELPEIAEQYRRVLLLNYPDYEIVDL